jgi:hypothetical protein
LLDDFLPHAVIELLVSDGNESSLNFERVILRAEVLEANDIAFHRHQSRGELFDLGAFRVWLFIAAAGA